MAAGMSNQTKPCDGVALGEAASVEMLVETGHEAQVTSMDSVPIRPLARM